MVVSQASNSVQPQSRTETPQPNGKTSEINPFVMLRTILRLKLTPGQRLVLIAIADHAGGEWRECTASYQTLADETRSNRREAIRAVKRLARRGLITIEATAHGIKIRLGERLLRAYAGKQAREEKRRHRSTGASGILSLAGVAKDPALVGISTSASDKIPPKRVNSTAKPNSISSRTREADCSAESGEMPGGDALGSRPGIESGGRYFGAMADDEMNAVGNSTLEGKDFAPAGGGPRVVAEPASRETEPSELGGGRRRSRRRSIGELPAGFLAEIHAVLGKSVADEARRDPKRVLTAGGGDLDLLVDAARKTRAWHTGHEIDDAFPYWLGIAKNEVTRPAMERAHTKAVDARVMAERQARKQQVEKAAPAPVDQRLHAGVVKDDEPKFWVPETPEEIEAQIQIATSADASEQEKNHAVGYLLMADLPEGEHRALGFRILGREDPRKASGQLAVTTFATVAPRKSRIRTRS